MGFVCYCGAEYTTDLEVNLLDEGIGRYFGIRWNRGGVYEPTSVRTKICGKLLIRSLDRFPQFRGTGRCVSTGSDSDRVEYVMLPLLLGRTISCPTHV